MSDTALINELTTLKAAGLSAAAAAADVMGATADVARQATGSPSPGQDTATGAIAPTDLSQALAVVFTPGLTAAELAAIIHTQFPLLSATEVAQAVLAGLPDTTSATMYAALTGCGFAAADAQSAVDIVYPAMVTIQSTLPWQTTGITVTGTQSTAIACSGSWTANPATGYCGPNGDGTYVAKPGYTLPGAAEGAMIGQVGDNPPFLVGVSATAPAGQSGMLTLCINDDLDRRYGNGLADNSGTMAVVVTTTASG